MSTARIDTQHALIAPHALLEHGWASDVLLVWNPAGTLVGVTPGAAGINGVRRAPGPVLPGMPNLHSHAFQRAFAGLTEYQANPSDSFWSWRDRMYRFAAALTPELLEDIATHLYVEMLRAGYTSVCEFHYVHHDAQGKPYFEPAEMALRISAAARRAGIGLTLLPVLYQTSGFGGKPPLDGQRRFINDVDALLRIVERLHDSDASVGIAPHSLRAVPPDALAHAVDGLHAMDAKAPVHIHIAEQQKEVDDCLAWSGQRPVQWLLDHAEVDDRWCLVHATHVDETELKAMAASRAVAGLCPSTEANLGDGVFPAAAFAHANGIWGIGSDSHACVDVAEELRLLEYSQRLALQRRNVMASSSMPDVAQHLWMNAVKGGAQASARPIAGLAAGQRADFVVLDAGGTMHGLSPAQMLASHVFARHAQTHVREVWVSGRRRVADGLHQIGDTARSAFVAARSKLLAEA
ncbi:formimidoylglutamate deiminase [Piscinibacter terrae]|uniref:Formimidoylglutamate deiminase n=1 Tax=Piscinibacter terrae TaxID=2496871 RepID=A0A3N7IZN1_9BURK|nr:formimidoylglutamate deiminase [Albitalea terrae]RQP24172.1 formimidoylglutamate deiminase [Albitalea terrae]